MPDPGPLNSLARRLHDAMGAQRALRDAGWAPHDRPMHQALKRVQQAFGGDDDPQRPPRDDMVDAVRGFVGRRRIESFTQLKYVCYGLTVPVDDDGKRLIDRTTLFQLLLDLVQDRQGQAKQFRRCYQGLLAAYFGFDRHGGMTSAGEQNWLKMRGYLDDRLDSVAAAARSRGRSVEWLDTLVVHRNLLTDKPCERYAKRLRAGDRSELEGACAGLDIAPTSWVWHEAVMAYVQEVVEAGDRAFKSDLPLVLAVVDGDQDGRRLPAPIARDAVALTVARYERSTDKPEHPLLRDVCLRRIGNPWLEREAWDAAVKSEPARKMIESWLKRRLIKDFFELLAHDGAADPRRLKYWLKWEPQISDMWFVLGTTARRNRTAPFIALRERMSGRDRRLTGITNDGNNAFAMRIGPLLVIEFGQTGNACYVFDAAKFKTDLGQMDLDIRVLKQRLHARRLSHVAPWEAKFDMELGIAARESSSSSSVLVPSNVSEPFLTPSVARRVLEQMPSQASQPPQSLVASANPVLRSNWPVFTPPKPASESTGLRQGFMREPNHPTERNPRAIDTRQLDALRIVCRRFDVVLQESSAGSPRTWILLADPSRAADLAALAEGLGFAFSPGKGYYVDRPNQQVHGTIEHAAKPTPPAKSSGTVRPVKVTAFHVDLLKRRCEQEGVGFEDNRAKGGAVWVRLTARPASAGLAGMLKGMGFKLAPGKGYYLSADD